METNTTSTTTTTISEKTKAIFDQIRQERAVQGKFIKLQAGEKKVLQFNPNKVQVVETEFDEPGKNTKRKTKQVHYGVIDPQTASDDRIPMEQKEKILPMSLTNAISINALLEKGLNLIEIQRFGTGRDTKYVFAPV
jgi:hypothetical protein